MYMLLLLFVGLMRKNYEKGRMDAMGDKEEIYSL